MGKALRPGRWLIYAILFGFALFTLLPLIVIVLNSFRTAVEIGRSSLIGWPAGLAWRNWSEAWGHFCIAQRCEGIRPYMENSFMMVVPATILSTALGAIAGYSISLWRFRGDTIVFAIVVMGVFLPEQMKLIPWALVLRELELTNTIGALVLIHTVQGFSFTTLFCRNYYIGIPQDLMTAARIAIATTPATDVVEYGVESAAVLLAAIPTLLVYFFGGRYFLRGLTAGAVK